MRTATNAELDERTRAQVLRRRDRFAMLLGVLTPMTREEAIRLFQPLPRPPRLERAYTPQLPVDLIDREDYRRIAV
jgi:hypothetical protein